MRTPGQRSTGSLSPLTKNGPKTLYATPKPLGAGILQAGISTPPDVNRGSPSSFRTLTILSYSKGKNKLPRKIFPVFPFFYSPLFHIFPVLPISPVKFPLFWKDNGTIISERYLPFAANKPAPQVMNHHSARRRVLSNC